MLKEPFESQDFVSFDTQYGDKVINLDIPRDNFDTDKCTVWLSLQDIGDLCNANIPFIKSSRLMNSDIFDSNEDIMRYQAKTGETQYSLSVSMMLMTEYAPTIANRFIKFATRKLCELYLEDKTKNDLKLRELPYKIDSMNETITKTQKECAELEKKITMMTDDIISLKLTMPQKDNVKKETDGVYEKGHTDEQPRNMEISSFQSLVEILQAKEENREPTENEKVVDKTPVKPMKNTEALSVYHDNVRDNEFFTVLEFMRLPSFNKLIPLNGLADESKLVISIKSILTQQANYIVRGEISKALHISSYEAKEMFNRIMDSWKSDNPKSLASLVPQECEKICHLFHYEKTYQFYREDGIKYNCLLSYPYSTLREAVKIVLRLHKLDEIIKTMCDTGILDDGIDQRAMDYYND